MRAVLLTLALAACSHTVSAEKSAEVARKHVVRFDPPSVPLSDFGRVRFHELQASDEVMANDKKRQIVERLQPLVDQRVRPLVDRINGRGSPGPELDVEVVIPSVRMVGGGSRFALGVLGGPSHIDVQLRFTDVAANQTFETRPVRLTTELVGSIQPRYEPEENLLHYAADIVREYLWRHGPPVSNETLANQP